MGGEGTYTGRSQEVSNRFQSRHATAGGALRDETKIGCERDQEVRCHNEISLPCVKGLKVGFIVACEAFFSFLAR